MENFSKLIGLLKVTSQNLKVLHRHMIGDKFFGSHEKFAEYYEKIDDMEDAVVEMSLAISGADSPISEVTDHFKLLEPKDYPIMDCYKMAKICFEKLIDLFDAAKNEADVPDFVKSELESYQYWLWLEASYKLPRLIKECE